MTLWLVRHGATEWSESGRLCGWSDVPLSPVGEDQARSLRGELASEQFAGVWASDLVRASRFATLAGRPALTDRRLRELDFGQIDGLTWEECDPMIREGLIRFDGFVAPGGESVDELRARVMGFLHGLGPGRHLIFTHGGVIKLVTREMGDPAHLEPGELITLDWPIPAVSSSDRFDQLP
jgi:probable phosphoglycerate mutase